MGSRAQPLNAAHLISSSYIGHFVFTQALLPILKRTAQQPNSDVRIVHVGLMHRERDMHANEVHSWPCLQVSSNGHDAIRHPVQFRSVEDFNPEYKDSVFPFPSLMRYCACSYLAAGGLLMRCSRRLQQATDCAVREGAAEAAGC